MLVLSSLQKRYINDSNSRYTNKRFDAAGVFNIVSAAFNLHPGKPKNAYE